MMKRTSTLVATALLASALPVATALPAPAPRPNKATVLKADLTHNYQPCTASDTSTNNPGPLFANSHACDAADADQSGCAFEAKGTGKLSLNIKDTDIKVKGKLNHLNALCEGVTFHAVVHVRATTDDCPTGHCTLVDQEIDLAQCTVAAGRCQIKEVVPSGFPAGSGSEINILGCGMKNGGTSRVTFVCGIMVK